MKKIDWGNGWQLSHLCFGVLPMGPLQKDMKTERGGEVLLEALRGGINFLDTAQNYRTYPHIRYALDRWDGEHIYVASKSTATSYDEMEEAVQEARDELNRDCIDIFLLHAARVGREVFRERAGALQCLRDCQEQGTVGRTGISTHSAEAVKQAAQEDHVDVVFPIINIAGLGILDGDRQDMEESIASASRAGKNLYAMKAFGGGNLLSEREEALEYVLSVPGIDSVCIGMVSADEVKVNLSLFAGEPDEQLMGRTEQTSSKRIMISPFCTACGTCIEYCPNDALHLDTEEEICRVDGERCILCGYCAPECPQFAIRMI